MIFVLITEIVPPEDILCNVAATGVSPITRKEANCTKTVLCKQFICNNFGRAGIGPSCRVSLATIAFDGVSPSRPSNAAIARQRELTRPPSALVIAR